MNPVNNNVGEAMLAASWLFQELMIPADGGTRDVAAQAILLEAKRRGGIEKSAKYILGRAIIDEREGKTVNRFWFLERRYLNKGPDNPGASNQQVSSEAEAYAMWQSMPEKFKRENPWTGAK